MPTYVVGEYGSRFPEQVGEKGLVRISADDGDTWAEANDSDFPTIYTYLRDVGFDPSGKVGYIVGKTGRILRSTDAGHEWKQVLPPEEAG